MTYELKELQQKAKAELLSRLEGCGADKENIDFYFDDDAIEAVEEACPKMYKGHHNDYYNTDILKWAIDNPLLLKRYCGDWDSYKSPFEHIYYNLIKAVTNYLEENRVKIINEAYERAKIA